MTEKDDLRARLYELHVGTDEHHATARQIRVMILDGDLGGAADALDALELDIHTALAAGGGGGTSLLTPRWASRTLTAAEVRATSVLDGMVWELSVLADSGTYTLTVDGNETDPIALAADDAAVRAAIESASGGTVEVFPVTAGFFRVVFPIGVTMSADFGGLSNDGGSYLTQKPTPHGTEIVAAPAGRLYHVIIATVAHARPATTPFSPEPLQVNIGWGSDLIGGYLPPFQAHMAPSFADGDAYAFAGFSTADAYSWPASSIEAQPITVWGGHASLPVTGGDGELTVRVLYATIDGAPPP
jgi:hypothetical protein